MISTVSLVGNLSDPTEHQWSVDHHLATPALYYVHGGEASYKMAYYALLA